MIATDMQFYTSQNLKKLLLQAIRNKHYRLLRWVVCINLFSRLLSYHLQLQISQKSCCLICTEYCI